MQVLEFFLLFVLARDIGGQDDHPPFHELPPYDGWFNNLVHPDWGAIDGQLIRRSLPKYADGVYHPSGTSRPNPFDISRRAHHGETGLPSKRNRTALLVFFGQQVVEEILDAQRPGCPIEYFNIPVPKDHAFSQGKDNLEMPFPRTRYDARTGYSPNNPRQQLNEITPYLDGTLFYGPGKAWTDAIREFKGGRLKTSGDPSKEDIKDSFPVENDIRLPFANPPAPRDHILRPVTQMWRIGNPRGFENPFLLAFGVLFFRWHNYQANEIEKMHSTWNDEAVFNEARRRVIAHHQKIVMEDWLPRWLHIGESLGEDTFFKIPSYYRNMSEPCSEIGYCYNGYSADIHPGITQEFQTAAMRWGHTVVTPGIWHRGPATGSNTCGEYKTRNIKAPTVQEVHAIRLCNAYWRGREVIDKDLDSIIRGMASTLAEQEDHILVPDLRDHVFGSLDFSRRDLAALNIQRARDHGLSGYNDIREAYGLPRVTWSEINNETDVMNVNPTLQKAIQDVRDLFGNTTHPDELDLFSGGMLETTFNGPGPLFRRILLDQFLRIRHSDRFWYESMEDGIGIFNEVTNKTERQRLIDEVKQITLDEIIFKVTRIQRKEIQDDVFIARDDPCPQPQQLKADSNEMYNNKVVIENCTRLQHYDYFSGSEVSFPITFVLLGLCVPATIGIMLLLNKRKQKEMEEAKRRMAPKREKTADPNTFRTIEWVGPTIGDRQVKVKFDKDRKKILVEDTRRKPLRMLDLRRIEGKAQKVHYRLANDNEGRMISIRLPGEIDLILKFNDSDERHAFVMNIDAFLQDLQINKEKHSQFTEKVIMTDANTKEKRQVLLDTFFRVVCLQAFKGSMFKSEIGHDLQLDELNKIRNIQLTRTEFSESLGLKPTSVFVRNMFLMVDKDRNGFVGFEEFLDLFQILAGGDAEEKARMIFNMYDIKRQGHLTRADFCKMLKSLLDLSDTSIDQKDLDKLVDTMYSSAGLTPAEKIGFESFSKIFASDEYGSTLQNATLNITSDGVAGAKPRTGFDQRRKTFVKSYNIRAC